VVYVANKELKTFKIPTNQCYQIFCFGCTQVTNTSHRCKNLYKQSEINLQWTGTEMDRNHRLHSSSPFSWLGLRVGSCLTQSHWPQSQSSIWLVNVFVPAPRPRFLIRQHNHTHRQSISTGHGDSLDALPASIRTSSSYMAFQRDLKTCLFKASFDDSHQ